MASKSFEEYLQDLEKIVKELETGDLPLEKALKRFEDGMAREIDGQPPDADWSSPSK